MSRDAELSAALEAVTHACALCARVRETLVSADTLAKRDRSPVTVADLGAQAVVAHLLEQRLPGIPLLAEEDAGDLLRPESAALRAAVTGQVRRSFPALSDAEILALIDTGGAPGGASGRWWTLDPIDGTRGFLRGEQYAVALALVEEGEVVLGVLGCPNLPVDPAAPGGPAGCLFAAVRGEGTVMRPLAGGAERRARVSPTTDPARAVFCESVEAEHSAHGDAARIAALLGIRLPPVRMDSQAKYAAVARGEASAYLRLPTRPGYEEKVWDHAAGWLVVTEAGGRVTDTRGRPLDFTLGRTLRDNRGVVATNGALHAPLLAAVREVLG